MGLNSMVRIYPSLCTIMLPLPVSQNTSELLCLLAKLREGQRVSHELSVVTEPKHRAIRGCP